MTGQTRGERNNNPGNLKFEFAGSADKTVTNPRTREQALESAQGRYKGVVDLDQWGNAVFESYEAGRVAKIQLLERRFGDLEYVQTWEAHASGWPHLNLLVTSPALIEHLDELGDERRWSEDAGHGKGRWCLWTPFRKELRGMVAASGLQRADWVERIDGGEGLAWYLAKIAHELSSAALKAADQTPIMAPAHFRRFRGSKGLIPKPVKYSWLRHVDEATGQITFDVRARNPDRESEWTGIVSPAPPGTFDERLPTWTGDWEEAMKFRDKVRDKAKAKAAAKAAGTWIETAHLETGHERR